MNILSKPHIIKELNRLMSAVDEFNEYSFKSSGKKGKIMFIQDKWGEFPVDQYREELCRNLELRKNGSISNYTNDEKKMSYLRDFICFVRERKEKEIQAINKEYEVVVIEKFNKYLVNASYSIISNESMLKVADSIPILIKENRKLILTLVKKGNIKQAFVLFVNAVIKETGMDLLHHIRYAITEEIVCNASELLKNEYNNYLVHRIESVNSLLNQDVKDLWKYYGKYLYDKCNMVNDFEFMNQKFKRIIKNKDIFNLSIATSNNIISIKYNTFNGTTEPVIGINKEKIKRIENTIIFLSENKFIKQIVSFNKDYLKEKSNYLKNIKTEIKNQNITEFMSLVTEGLIVPELELDVEKECFKYGVKFIKLTKINICYDKCIDEIKKDFNLLLEKVKKNCTDIRNKIKNTLKDIDNYNILKLIIDTSKRGITTYISILHGDETSKMLENSYNKLPSYAKLSHLKKNIIEEKINYLEDINCIHCSSCRTSYGSYMGYSIDSAIKKRILSVDVVTEVAIEKGEVSIKELLHEIQGMENAGDYLLSVEINKIDHSDIVLILDFIINNRKCFAKVESLFIDKLCGLIPIKYAPIFEMNSNLEKGVTSKTLNKFSEKLREGEFHG